MRFYNDHEMTDGPDGVGYDGPGYVESEGRNQLTGLAEHERDSQFPGDARRCPAHPHVKTSSDDGMFDGVCGECEAAMDEEANMRDWVGPNGEDLSEDYPGQYISAPGDSAPADTGFLKQLAVTKTWDDDDIPF